VLYSVIICLFVSIQAIQGAKWRREYSKELSEMSGFCYEMFAGIEQIKLNGAAGRIIEKWSEKYLSCAEAEDKPFLLKYGNGILKLISILSMAFVFVLGSELSAPDYIAFSSAYGAYLVSSMSFGDIVRVVTSLRASFSLMKPVLDSETEAYGEEKVDISDITGEISFSNVYFRYDKKSSYVLNGISLNIKKGESVGIVGTSGCGKSTLIRLLLGFEDADEGSITVDGFDLRELNLKKYRQRIGTVLQNAGLISGDIFTNITVTKPGATLDEVNRVLELVGLKEDIDELPMGLHTPISEDNCTLSGGQRQRVLIARALISNPAIIIFDEATSALDNITQAKITESMQKLDCTKIIVAHRLSTVEDCDRIIVMDKGTVAESGAYHDLIEKNGLFANLVRRQQISMVK